MRVKRLTERFSNLEIRYVAFPLHPETPDDGLTLEELFAGRDIDLPAAQAAMRKRMEAEGLPYGERTHTYNSRLAQELASWAERQPGGEWIHDRLFKAYFVNGQNLAQVDTLLAIVEDLGLDVATAREVLQQRRQREAVDADWQRSRAYGITGVPTFVIGNRGVVGAQPYETLADFVRESGGTPA